MKKLLSFLKNWTLPVAMVTGAACYLLYARMDLFDPLRPYTSHVVSYVQPALIFLMLVLSFCKIRPHDLRLTRWAVALLLFQLSCFVLCVWALTWFQDQQTCVLIESALLCLICPTATAAVVVTGKLGGNQATLTTYTIIINLAVALMVPTLLPLAHPLPGLHFHQAFGMIIGRVFPLLFCPFLLAMALRTWCPRMADSLVRFRDFPFYLWAVSLALAIAVTVRSIVHSHYSLVCMGGIAMVSALCCALQFCVGRHVGRRYGEPVSGAQACGQKNTVFAIWMGYTFLDPVTSLAGGFYSVWHNMYNSWQLYRQRKLG